MLDLDPIYITFLKQNEHLINRQLYDELFINLDNLISVNKRLDIDVIKQILEESGIDPDLWSKAYISARETLINKKSDELDGELQNRIFRSSKYGGPVNLTPIELKTPEMIMLLYRAINDIRMDWLLFPYEIEAIDKVIKKYNE